MLQKLSVVLIPGITALCLFIAVDSVTERGSDPTTPTLSAEQLDYQSYSENINTVLFTESGDIDYTLSAQRQYQQQDGNTIIEQPFIRLFEEGEAHWRLTANSGIVLEQTTADSNPDIELTGDVNLISLRTGDSRTELSTERLLVHTDTETAETDAAVQLRTDTMLQNANGMYADLTKDMITFTSDIRGRHVPVQTKP